MQNNIRKPYVVPAGTLSVTKFRSGELTDLISGSSAAVYLKMQPTA